MTCRATNRELKCGGWGARPGAPTGAPYFQKNRGRGDSCVGADHFLGRISHRFVLMAETKLGPTTRQSMLCLFFFVFLVFFGGGASWGGSY